jgi:hypothetical protein
MDNSNKNSTEDGTAPAKKYDFLRRKGIKHLQQMAAGDLLWTDFNTHDPGITILEQLCYAITDIAYRIDYPLPDLLAAEEDIGDTLFSPAEIMTTHLVTLDDLRKLALDDKGVKPEQKYLLTPTGRDRNITAYHSIQHQFPACFGVGEMGLPASASSQRHGQAKQIKAFLTWDVQKWQFKLIFFTRNLELSLKPFSLSMRRIAIKNLITIFVQPNLGRHLKLIDI